jgi:hypothetical protein
MAPVPHGVNPFVRQGFPANFMRGQGFRAPAPPRPGMPFPVGPSDSPTPSALVNPDPRIMREIEQKEQEIQMVESRDDVSPWQKQFARNRLTARMNEIDPLHQYRQGSPLRSMSPAEQQFSQGYLTHPDFPGVILHPGPRGQLVPWQYDFRKGPQQRAPLPVAAQHFAENHFVDSRWPHIVWTRGHSGDWHKNEIPPREETRKQSGGMPQFSICLARRLRRAWSKGT